MAIIAEFKKAIREDPRLKLIFWGGLLVQLVFAVTSVGYHFPDQHFQIIEFSSAQSGEPTGAPFVWEWENHVRPTVQIYLFTGFHQAVRFIGINNPFTEMLILRILLSVAMFLLFNLLTYTYFKEERKAALLGALIILNFSWFLPYLRTQYSAEIFSCFFFFGTVLLYQLKKDHNPGVPFLILVGVLFGFTFYIRIQTLLFLAGFGIWLIWVQKARKHILPILAGFVAGCAFNLLLDSLFYHEVVFTPYTYFYANMIQGRAASMGTSGVWFYIGIMLAHTAAPVLNLILLYYGIKAYRRKYAHLVFIVVALFLIGHSLVGHKEDRFLFPIFNVVPVILGFGIVDFLDYYKKAKAGVRRLLKGLVTFSIALNFILLVLFAFNPWCQSVQFLQKLYHKFEKTDTRAILYYVNRSPFGNPQKSPLIYYQKAFNNVHIVDLKDLDTLPYLPQHNVYLALTFNDIKDDRHMIDSLGFKPVMYSSQLLWHINEFLSSKNTATINEIWVLYNR